MKDYDEEYNDSGDGDDDTSRAPRRTAVQRIDAEALVACCDVCYEDVRDGIRDGIRYIWRLPMLRVASRGRLGTAVEPACPLMRVADALVPLSSGMHQ